MTEPSTRGADAVPTAASGHERFRTRKGHYERVLTLSNGRRATSVMAGHAGSDARPVSADEAERAWLRSTVAPPCGRTQSSLRVVDLFSGCGGLSIGLAEAARALNRSFEPVLAVDVDKVAVATYAANFPTAATVCKDVTEVLPGKVGARRSSAERMLAKSYGHIDVLVGGPPCQGHSDFNNRTRHADAITSAGPATREPTGAASPFDRQHMTVVAGAASVAAGTPVAISALKRRAPSRCTRTP